jgi:hypothetical protein
MCLRRREPRTRVVGMTHDPTAARLFPDLAATPTRTERVGTRRYWAAAQGAMPLATDDPSTIDRCASCAGPHASDECPHGTALALPTGDTNP